MITAFWVAFTLAGYAVSKPLYLKYPNPFLHPVIVIPALIIAVLTAWGPPYTAYEPAKDLMTVLLPPATVSLALPLYRHRKLLRLQALPILCGVALGAASAMLSAALIARLGGLPREVVMSILPKGISIPFAVEVAAQHGGIPALAAAFVVATGTMGTFVGSWSLTRCGITDPLSRGLALGTASHAQGTAIALQEGEAQGAMAGLAMILAGLFTAAVAPLAVNLLDFIPG